MENKTELMKCDIGNSKGREGVVHMDGKNSLK